MATPTPWTRLRRRIEGYEKKAADMTDAHGIRAARNLLHLHELRRAIDAEIDREVIRAREQWAAWSSSAFGSIKHAAQQRHAAAIKRRR